MKADKLAPSVSPLGSGKAVERVGMDLLKQEQGEVLLPGKGYSGGAMLRILGETGYQELVGYVIDGLSMSEALGRVGKKKEFLSACLRDGEMMKKFMELISFSAVLALDRLRDLESRVEEEEDPEELKKLGNKIRIKKQVYDSLKNLGKDVPALFNLQLSMGSNAVGPSAVETMEIPEVSFGKVSDRNRDPMDVVRVVK